MSHKYLGTDATAGAQDVDKLGLLAIGAGPLHYYGLYVSPDLKGRGESFKVNLPKGQEGATLDKLEAAAREIGKDSRNTFMGLKVKFDTVVELFGRKISTKVDVAVNLQVGLGYDFVKRNAAYP